RSTIAVRRNPATRAGLTSGTSTDQTRRMGPSERRAAWYASDGISREAARTSSSVIGASATPATMAAHPAPLGPPEPIGKRVQPIHQNAGGAAMRAAESATAERRPG